MKKSKISHIVLCCIITSYAALTHAIRPFTAGAGTALSAACALALTYSEPTTAVAVTSGLTGITSWFLYRMTPAARLKRADDKLASVGTWVSDPHVFAKLESPEEQHAFYEKMEHYFASKDFPLAAAKNDFNAALTLALDARELAQKAQHDLSPQENVLSERCTWIIKRAQQYQQKTTQILTVINHHPDYIRQMSSQEQTTALQGIQAATTISAINSFNRK